MHDHPPWHFGASFANRMLDWLPTDSKERFQESIADPEKRKILQQKGWDRPGAFNYIINSFGFRGDDFDTESDCIIALGCSYTIGVGLPQQQTWPWLVGEKLNLAVCNLAWPGNSADTCYRLAEYWIPCLKPKYVFMLSPPKARIEFFTDGFENLPDWEILNSMRQTTRFHQDKFLKYWFGFDENQDINLTKNKHAIESIATKNNSKFISIDSDWVEYTKMDYVGPARDFMHAGPAGHVMITDQMLNKLYG